jgi:molybdate transport system substrate-binding protein
MSLPISFFLKHFRRRGKAMRGRELLLRRLMPLLVLLVVATTAAPAAEIPAIAAAADLKFALSEIATQFKRETGRELRLSFGSSGNFTRQIEQGAPFEMFLSADENYIFRLAEQGRTVDRGRLYALGQVGLFVPHGSQLRVDAELADLRAALQEGRIKRFAIANPEHAPYGRAARALLESTGLWDSIEAHLVLGENAAQAMQFAASGASQGGIVPLALALAPEIARRGQFILLPAAWYARDPLRQRMVLLKSAGDSAAAFYAYLLQPAAREILARYGFVEPPESE